MNFNTYKNTKEYPNRADYTLWILSLIDTNTEEIIDNIVTECKEIDNTGELFLLEFFKDNIDEKTTYVEYGSHTLDYDLKNEKVLCDKDFRYHTKSCKTWNYPKYTFYLKFEKLGKHSAKYDEKMKEYNEETNRLYNLFKEDLFKELDIVNNPKKDLLFSKAWERGHSSGYEAVYHVAENLVDLIK